MVSTFKSTSGWRRITRAWGYSLNGLRAAFRHEAAFRQELLLVVILTPLAFLVGDSPLQVALLLISLLGVLIVELLNSAVETLADAVSVEHHPLIGRAKDIGSAAVLLAIVGAAGIWLTVWLF
ncbi:diacylglycerol kinase [Pusillimonas sp. CC-YST705]|uniref:Diacylglycerol kinase n=1 Tax=Mesopusillimonas faecipullorum TaxID=2755040 RepID=A0ABS8CDM8_9BURK|nr:diacylglycerol kinase [Mesopusillimonas faecipullorum]MCB5364150.1 diacylglycerol kinase [Mesopusillimonas faecipullorum]